MKKVLYLVGFIGLIIVLYVGYLWFKYTPETYMKESLGDVKQMEVKNEVTGTTSPSKSTASSTTLTKTTFTMEEVATHKSIESCYSVIQGSVYDLTFWVNLHPGGKNAILSICGIDGTERFMKKHKGGEKFMTILARYKIGTLQ
jgi:cytochrome b involved in lipid metabolism